MKKPFIYGCISGGVGAIVASFFHIYYYAYAGLPGPLTIVNSINSDNPSSFIGILIGGLIGLTGPIVLTQIFGTGETLNDAQDLAHELDEDKENTIASDLNTNVYTPISGNVIALSDVSDDVFSTGAMGDGLAIEPNDNKVYAPFSGTVSAVLDSKHAVGLTSVKGVELLIHVGIDTVNMRGEGFNCFVEQDQEIEKGDLLIEFNRKKIENAGYPLTTIVVVPNSTQLNKVTLTEKELVTNKDILLECH